MGWSKNPKYAEVDAENPSMWTTCDRCSRIWNSFNMAWQYDYRGSAMLQNLRILCCPTCLDVPQIQLSPYNLPPDPPPIYNARPEPYFIEEESFLSTAGSTPLTLDGDTLVTADGDPITPNEPNPADDASTTHLTTDVPQESGE